MRTAHTLLLILLVLAAGCGSSVRGPGEFSLSLPSALTKAAVAGDLEAYLTATNGTEMKTALMTIADGQVSGTLNLKPGTWTLEIQFFQMSTSGNWIPIAFLSFGSREIGNDGMTMSYDPADIQFNESEGIQPSISSSVGLPSGCVARFDCDGDGYSNFDEMKNGSNPEDATSLPATAASQPQDLLVITLNLAEGEKVRDRKSIRAEATAPAGIRSIRLTSPEGIADENSDPDLFIATWDTTTFPEDNDLTLTFEAEDKNGRKSTKSVTVKVDNVPNIASFGTDILIQSGQTANLAWEADNFATLSLDGGIGTLSDATGTRAVSPATTTTYRLTASRFNSFGQTFTKTKEVTVTVNHAPVFDGHTTTLLGQDPSAGTTVSFNRSDSDSGETLTSTATLFNGTTCAGTPVATQTTTTGSLNFTGLDPRTDYSYTVSVSDGRGGSATSSCRSFTTSDTGLVGWWRMDENRTDLNCSGNGNFVTADSSGSGNNATLLNTPCWGDGVSGSGLELNLSGPIEDSLTIPHDPSLDNLGDAGSAFSFEIWFKTLTTDITAHEQLMNKGDGTKGFGMNLDAGSDSVNFELTNTSTGTNEGVAGTTDVVDGNWHQAVVTVGGGNLRMYLDGSLEDASTYPDNVPFSNTADILVGTIGGSRLFQGTLDEIAFYERVLSVDEIRRNCRRNDPSNICPDPKEPIILTPLPGQTLPPTRAFWSWRGERDRDGNPLYPNMEYDVSFDLGADSFGILSNDIFTSGDTEFHVRGSLSQNSSYQIHVTPVENGTELTSLESARLFSTDDSVVAWYNFDQDLLGVEPDQSGNNNDGDWSGHPLDGTPAQITNGEFCPGGGIIEGILGLAAVCLDGVDDYLIIPHAAFPDIGATGVDFSVGVRLNTASAGSVESLFSKVETSGNSNEVALTLNGATPKFELNNSLGENLTLYANAAINDQAWHDVVGTVTFDATATARLAVDGQYEAIGTYPVGWNFNNTADILMGRYRMNSDQYYNGLIDELVIYNKALSGEAILNSHCAIEALAGTDPLPEVCAD